VIRHSCLLGVQRVGETIPPAGTFTQVSAGAYYNCAVKTDGTLACWGRGTEGQTSPPPNTFTQVSGGDRHTCGVKTDGTLACCGFNDYGQTNFPVGTFTQVSAGSLHTCGVRTDSAIVCWGDNGWGQTLAIVAAFTGGPRTGSLPLYVCFTDNSVTAPHSWSWNFGDSLGSTQMNPGHTYRAPGSYEVSLTVQNAAGSSMKSVDSYITVSSCPQKPVRMETMTGAIYFDTIQLAYDTVSGASVIMTQAIVFPEDLNFDIQKTVTLRGGFPCDYALTTIPETVLQGRVTVSAGMLIIDGLVIE